MSDYTFYKTAKASLRSQMPDADANYFAVATGINPLEYFSADSLRSAMGLLASITGENYSADDYLFISQIKYYPAD